MTRMRGKKIGPSFRLKKRIAAKAKALPALRKEGKIHTLIPLGIVGDGETPTVYTGPFSITTVFAVATKNGHIGIQHIS